MSSEAEHSAGRPPLRGRSSRRTFRPRHRLSKPKLDDPPAPGSPEALPPVSASPEPPRSDAGDAPRGPSPAFDPVPRETAAVDDAAPELDAEGQPHESAETQGYEADPPADRPPVDSGSRAPETDYDREREHQDEGDAESAEAGHSAGPPAEVTPAMIPGSVESLAYRPASPRSIEQAVLEVKRVVDALQEALTDMEEVLELIEDAEQQKVADEREVNRLQELVRQLTQVRDRLPQGLGGGLHRAAAGEGGGAAGHHSSHGSGYGRGGEGRHDSGRGEGRSEGRGEPRGEGRHEGRPDIRSEGRSEGRGDDRGRGEGRGDDRSGGGRHRRRGRGRGRERGPGGYGGPGGQGGQGSQGYSGSGGGRGPQGQGASTGGQPHAEGYADSAPRSEGRGDESSRHDEDRPSTPPPATESYRDAGPSEGRRPSEGESQNA